MRNRVIVVLIAILLCTLAACEKQCAHEYQISVIKEASCLEEGEKALICKLCGDSYTESIPKTNHDYREEKSDLPDTVVYRCAICQDHFAVEVSTDPAETVTTEPADAAMSGERIKTEVVGQNRGEEILEHTHTYKTEMRLMPTCTKEGKQVYTCTTCGFSYEETVKCLGHDYSRVQIMRAPTCTDAGVRRVFCQRCNDGVDESIAAAGHEWTAATCEESACCKKCNANKGEAPGHRIKNGTCEICGMVLNTPEKNKQVEAEKERHSLAVRKIHEKINVQVEVNQNTIRTLQQRYGIESVLNRADYLSSISTLKVRLETLTVQLHGETDAAEQQKLQAQITALQKELQKAHAGLSIAELQESNRELEKEREALLAQENKLHEENLKAIEKS